MASKGLQSFSKGMRTLRSLVGSKDPLTQCLAPRLSRSMATETSLPQDDSHTSPQSTTDAQPEFSPPRVLTTIFNFPSMEPLRYETYSSKHLHLPLRRDILHRAVIFEGDATRQGTASTKRRWEIHGSHRKLRPQKGTGSARLGSKQSPMLKGGAKVFGPRPRDFSTELPRKMYDLAWRTALSWRYRKGDLIVCEDGMDIQYPETWFMRQILEHNHWGKAAGRSLIIANEERDNLFTALTEDSLGGEARLKLAYEVDVKDLLETRRVIIEKSALDQLLREHQSDLASKIKTVV